jgi:hypothetical protein
VVSVKAPTQHSSLESSVDIGRSNNRSSASKIGTQNIAVDTSESLSTVRDWLLSFEETSFQVYDECKSLTGSDDEKERSSESEEDSSDKTEASEEGGSDEIDTSEDGSSDETEGYDMYLRAQVDDSNGCGLICAHQRDHAQSYTGHANVQVCIEV